MKKPAKKKTAKKKTKLNHICDLVDCYIDEEITQNELVDKLVRLVGKPIIKISEMEFVVNEWKDGLYLNCRSTFSDGSKDNWVDVCDLTELKIWEYNKLVDELHKHYPDYPIEHLEGRFV